MLTFMARHFLNVIFIVGWLSSCTPAIKIFSDYDKDVNVSGCSYYSWLDEKAIEGVGLNPIYYNELNDKRIKHAADDQLNARGFLFADTASCLVMHYHLVVKERSIAMPDLVPHYYNSYWLSRNAVVYPYEEGTLIIDLMDNRNRALVWRGSATGVIEDVVNKNPEAAISLAMQKIFKRFPLRR